jgi:glycosyltransferase involved in cell wall biosynthesis
MTQPLRIAFIGNSLPRRCGIATFTTDLQEAVSASHPRVEATIVAMNDRDRSYAYPEAVRAQIQDDRLEDYVRAADDLNMRRLDVVCLQHEFGIFGGEAGANVLALLSRLKMPIVTTLHTVLAEPSPVQRRVFGDIVGLSAKVVVMAEKGRELLRSIYAVPAEKIEIIPHGIHDTQ